MLNGFNKPDMPRHDEDEPVEKSFKGIDEFEDTSLLDPAHALMEKEEEEQKEKAGEEKKEDVIWPSDREHTGIPLNTNKSSGSGLTEGPSSHFLHQSSEMDTRKKELSWQLRKANKTSKERGKGKRK